MTRENKLALIIGFSLILVVAILLADHLSPAQQSEMNALDTMFTDSPQISLPSGGTESPQGQAEPGSRRAVMQPVQMNRDDQADPVGDLQIPVSHEPDDEGVIKMGHPLPAGDHATGGGEADESQAQFHVVHKTETLYGIAKDYYGDGSLYEALARFNADRISSDGTIRAGTTLLIPSRETLIGRGPGKAPESSNPTPYRTYTIQENDRLWDIAKKFLKKGSRYPEIVKLNKDIIKDADVLPVGKTIRIPN